MPRRRNRAWRRIRLSVRLALRAIDRQTPEWMRWLTPWGSSLALHALALLILAAFVFTNTVERAKRPQTMDVRLGGDPLGDDLTALMPSEVEIEPFAPSADPEPPAVVVEAAPTVDPSLSLAPPRGSVAETDKNPGKIPLAQPGSNLAKTAAGQPGAPFDLTSNVPFAGRHGTAKARLLRSEGGTAESERAVDQGLDWIVRHQREDGSWSLNHKPQCRGAGCPADRAMESDTAATGLALLPLLGAGVTHDEKSRHQIPVAKGLTWLIKHQNPKGGLFTGGGGNTHMYSHAVATMALCESYGVTKDPRLREPAQRAIDFIAAAQDPKGGGWRYNPHDLGDTSVFGWQMLAIRSAHLAKLSVDDHVITRCVHYLDTAATNPTRTKYAYQPKGGATPVMTAEALLIRQYLGWSHEDPGLNYGVGLVYDHLARSKERNIYYWYYATQLLHNMHGPSWRKWNAYLRDNLVRTQVGGDGCDRGSWDPHKPVADRWGAEAGRHFVTTMSLLTLEVYYRYLPVYQSPEGETLLPKSMAAQPDGARGKPGG